MLFSNVITIPASTNGGQQGVIAQDRRLRRAGAQEGAPSSKKLLILKLLPPSRAMYHPSHLPGAVPRAIELCTFSAQDRVVSPPLRSDLRIGTGLTYLIPKGYIKF